MKVLARKRIEGFSLSNPLKGERRDGAIYYYRKIVIISDDGRQEFSTFADDKEATEWFVPGPIVKKEIKE